MLSGLLILTMVASSLTHRHTAEVSQRSAGLDLSRRVLGVAGLLQLIAKWAVDRCVLAVAYGLAGLRSAR